MTAPCVRCEQHHDGEGDLCALCAAAVALDNAETEFARARAVCGSAHYEGHRLDVARRAYHAPCLGRPMTKKFARVEKRSSK